MQLVLLLVAVCFDFVFVNVSPSKTPMLMVVSLDGFRPDYLFRVKPPMKNIKKIYQKGVLAPSGIIPCYATKTFPNHYSIATGLFEESHGIIDNEMYNANKTPAYFHFTSDAPDWWDNGLNMPVWILNEKKGQSSGIIMWPGGGEKIDNISVTHHVPFNSSVTLHSRIDFAFSFLTSSTSPANCIFLYFHQPDLVSHDFGPFSNETMKFLEEIDEGIGYLLEKIESYELENLLNLIVMSDHGVDVLLSSNQIQINDIAPTSICNVYGVGPISGVIPHPGKFEEVFSYLKQKSNIYNFTVTKRREFPDSAHFKNNDNVPEILIRTEPGYQFINKIDTGPAPYRGVHGYNNTYAPMRALFVARGPAFKENIVAEPFLNVHLYSLMCHILGLDPAPNNGSLDAIAYILANDLGGKSRHSTYNIDDIAFSVSFVSLVTLFVIGCVAVYFQIKHKSKGYKAVTTESGLSEDIVLFETNKLIDSN